MTSQVNPTVPDASTRTELDDRRALEAELWRIHTILAPHWLHALRGSLNAMSLNLVLLGSGPGGQPRPAQDPSWQAIRTQLKELDAGLTRLLDRGAFETESERAELVSSVTAARALLEPFTKKRQVSFQSHVAEFGVWVAMRPQLFHGVLVVLLHGLASTLQPKGALTLEAEAAGGVVRLDIAAPPGPEPQASELLSDVVPLIERVLQRAGGSLTCNQTADGDTWRIALNAAPRELS